MTETGKTYKQRITYFSVDSKEKNKEKFIAMVHEYNKSRRYKIHSKTLTDLMEKGYTLPKDFASLRRISQIFPDFVVMQHIRSKALKQGRTVGYLVGFKEDAVDAFLGR